MATELAPPLQSIFHCDQRRMEGVVVNFDFRGQERYIGFHFSAHTMKIISLEPVRELELLRNGLET